MYDKVKTTDLGEAEFLLIDTGRIDLFPNPVEMPSVRSTALTRSFLTGYCLLCGRHPRRPGALRDK